MAFSSASRHPALLRLLLLVFIFCPAVSHGFQNAPTFQIETIRGAYGERALAKRSAAEDVVRSLSVSPLPNTSFALAAERTHRRDPMDDYKYYTGGWNLSNQHYWASVGSTAAPLFLFGILWFLGFGLALIIIIGFFYCCWGRRNYSYSRKAYALSLILLIFFTSAAIIGCVVLYTGLGKFHSSTSDTFDYIVGQANYTVENLKKFSDYLAAAKEVNVDKIFLSEDVQKNIDAIEIKLKSSASDLGYRTIDNLRKIENFLDSVTLDLIIIGAVMLLLAFLGFLFSILGLQSLVYISVLAGWVLVAGTFSFCGVSLLVHNVVADTCVAMDEWVQHPHEHTALDDILPCVDASTANESLYRSKEVSFQLVKVVNQYVANISNGNFPSSVPAYYNQSGPSVPVLCNPFASDLTHRQCANGEVHFGNASQVWEGYVCDVSTTSGREICNTVGRITPSTYKQMTAAANISYGLYHYGPFLANRQDCTFVRDTFAAISSQDCPGLRLHSEWIYIGLAMFSYAVMLSLIIWVIHATERRHRKYNKQVLVGSSQLPSVQYKAP